MLPNIKTRENGWLNFSENLRIVSLKLHRVNSLLITKSINLQLFTLILYGFGLRCDRRRFYVNSPFIKKSLTANNYFHDSDFKVDSSTNSPYCLCSLSKINFRELHVTISDILFLLFGLWISVRVIYFPYSWCKSCRARIGNLSTWNLQPYSWCQSCKAWS